MKNAQLPEEPHSFWIETEKRKSYPKLMEDLQVDIAVIGGGIAGILTAYSLAKEGKDVALFEGRELMSGTTGHTTAKLSAQHQLIYDELIQRYGAAHARRFYQANMDGIEYIKQITKEHDLDCNIKEQSAYVYTQQPSKKEKFKQEAKAYKKLNIDGQLLTNLSLDMEVAAAIQMNDQAEFQPVTFLHGVLGTCRQLKDRIYEHSLINDVNQDSDGILRLKTANGYSITCNHAIFATHYPTFEPDEHYTNMAPEISYALAYETNKQKLDGMYISDDIPKKTFRKMRSGNKHYLLVGGQSHPIGDDNSEMSRYQEIDQFAKDTFNVGDSVYRWSSHDLITKDRIPLIGQLHPDYPNVYTATGFSKWGLADAATGACLLTDLVLGRENEYKEMYYPRRAIPDLPENTTEASDAEEQIEQLVMPNEIEDLSINEATIIEKDKEKIGVYKDHGAKIHYMDLSCTHMGCGLQWNNGDKTWDCPCHGSRFNAYGKVIEGPALVDLDRK